ncbi:patatin-like phospholipase domain-containing protein, putative [Eimeria praecox]|uniref:Patatin-like phospholipase domain-containing protein, putative n=1 Tax=Eimeria praecox TaxID=51316 RepID=U6G5A2_9EIME|nr:patatin-like phospholipase domain-containing protein, putative [Eimeria praecox]
MQCSLGCGKKRRLKAVSGVVEDVLQSSFCVEQSVFLQPLWDALYLGFTNMRLECQYSVEPPTDPTVEAPSWSPASGAVLHSSVSGLMRLVSEKSRGLAREASGAFSFPLLTDDLEANNAKLGQGFFSSRQPASQGPASSVQTDVALLTQGGEAAAVAAVAAAAAAAAAVAAGGDSGEPSRTWGSAALAPLCLGMDPREAPPKDAKEGGWGAEQVAVELLTEDCKGEDETPGSIPGEGAEVLIDRQPIQAGEKTDKNNLQNVIAMQGVSLQGLFSGLPSSGDTAAPTPLEAATFEVHPKDEKTAGADSGVKDLSQESAGVAEGGNKPERHSPARDEAVKEAPRSPSSAQMAVLANPRNFLSPGKKPEEQGETETAGTPLPERDASERSTAGCEGSTVEHPKDTDTVLSEGGPTRDLHREEPLHAGSPSHVATEENGQGGLKTNDAPGPCAPSLGETSSNKRPARWNSSRTADTPPQSKLLLRTLSMPPLQSRLVQMTGAGSAGWGGLEVMRALGALPEGLIPEEESEELHEDVLFYEADGHYTETGEEYCMPLGEQQQLVKLLRSNVVSVRAKSRKFSFLFVPAAGSHLFIDLRASLSLGMALSATLELVYCGAPTPLYKGLPSLYAPTDRKCVLSLDGAGLYAAVGQLAMLRQLEKEVRFLLGDRRISLANCFDLIVGTGTARGKEQCVGSDFPSVGLAGGLLALALLRGISVVRLLREWTGVGGRNLDELSPDWKASFFMQLASGMEQKTLRSELVDKFGWRFLNSFNSPLGVITCSNVAQSPPQTFLLRTYEHTSPGKSGRNWGHWIKPCTLLERHQPLSTVGGRVGNDSLSKDIEVGILEKRQLFAVCKCCPAVRLTGATSTDALASNPTLAGLDECARLAHKPLRNFIQSDLQLLVSLGAREFFSTPSARQGPLVHNENKEPFATEGLTAATMSGHREVLHWLADRLDVYFRFNMPVVGNIRLSPSNPFGLTDLMAVASEYITDEKFFEMKKAAKILAHSLKARMYEKAAA